MTPADKLLDHYDCLAGGNPRFIPVSDEGFSPAMCVAIYRDFPEPGAITGFTVGLSHFLPRDGGHKELTVSMRDSDESWALACGYLAFRLREKCPFVCGDTINFCEEISPSSAMSAFVAVHPRWLSVQDAVVDLSVRRVEIVQLLPLYEKERTWLNDGWELQLLLRAYDPSELMNPGRKPFGTV
jgi:hypothetical protein